MPEHTLLNWEEASLRSLSQQSNEPDSLLKSRLSALARLKTTAWPNAMQESWRRTDPAAIGTRKFKLWNPDIESQPAHTDEISPACCSWLFMHNCQPLTSVIVSEHHRYTSLFGALKIGIAGGDRQTVDSLINLPEDKDSPAIGLLNQAYYHGGFYVHIPAFAISSRPIWVRHTVNTPNAALLTVNGISLGAGAEATVMIESLARTKEPSWFNQRTVINVGSGANLHLIALNESEPNVKFYDHLQIHLANNATCRVTWGDLTQGWTVIRRETDLNGKGSEAILKGVHVGVGDGSLDLRTLQDHPAPNTTSNLLYKSAMFDNARTIYQGLIIVRPHALNANAYQLNRNLLMSANSRSDSIPKLEIEVDEVRCTHGASSGKLDKDALFYLMSRGMPLETATQLLIEGFLGEVSDYLPEGAIKNYWRNEVFGVSRAALAKL